MSKLRWLTLAVALLLGCCAAAAADEAVVITTDVEELIVAVGETADYKLRIKPDEARRAGYTFTISDESVAQVTERGLVKGVAAGECTLLIASDYDPSATKTLPVTVVRPVKKLTAAADKSTIFIGESTQIDVGYAPEDASMKEAVFTSSDSDIAQVFGDGQVEGISRGRAVITVHSKDGKAKASVHITVHQQPESITLSSPSTVLATGKRMTIKATVLPKNTDNKK